MIANFSVVRNEKRLKIPIKIINFFFSIKSSSFELWYFKNKGEGSKKKRQAGKK